MVERGIGPTRSPGSEAKSALVTAGQVLLDGIGDSPTITERENASIRLSNSFTAKLSDVLMMSGMKTNLLFMQALRMQKIVSQQELHEYEFYKNSTIIAKDIHHSKTSYLI